MSAIPGRFDFPLSPLQPGTQPADPAAAVRAISDAMGSFVFRLSPSFNDLPPNPSQTAVPAAAQRAITAAMDSFAFRISPATNDVPPVPLEMQLAMSTHSPFFATDLMIIDDNYAGTIPWKGIKRPFFEILESTFRRIKQGDTNIRIADPPQKPEFKLTVLTFLMLALTRPIGREIIYPILKHTDKVITILPVDSDNPENTTCRGTNDNEIDIYLKLDPDAVIVLSKSQNNLKPQVCHGVAALAHELAHAEHMCKMTRDRQRQVSNTPPSLGKHYTNAEEQETIIHEENAIREQLGLLKRVGHLSVDFPAPPQAPDQPDTIAYFHQVCKGGCEQEVRRLLEAGMKPDSLDPEDEKKRTPLMRAAKYRHQNIMRILLDKKADPLKLTADKRSLLHFCIASGQLDIVKFLFSTIQFPVPKADREGHPLFYYTITHLKEKSIPFLEFLAQYGASPRMLTPTRESALFPAAGLADTTIFDRLVQSGLDPYAINNNKESPLHAALRSGNVALAQRLLVPRTSAKLYVLTADENSLMHAAAESGNIEAVDFLLTLERQFGEPHKFTMLANEDGIVPLGSALENAQGKEGQMFIRALRERGFSFSRPLFEQLLPEHVNFVSLFARADEPLRTEMLDSVYTLYNIDQPLCHEKPLLHWAIEAGDEALAKYALQRGAQVYPDVNKRIPPLHLAVMAHQPGLIRLLREYGAKVNATDKDGHTPLELAVEIFHQTKLIDPRVLLELSNTLPYKLRTVAQEVQSGMTQVDTPI